MGMVHEVRQSAVGRPLAVNALLAGADEAITARFRREATALVRVKHPGVVW